MEWDRWKKLTVKVRLRIIYIYIQMDHGEAKLTANLQSVWTTTRQVMAITRTLHANTR